VSFSDEVAKQLLSLFPANTQHLCLGVYRLRDNTELALWVLDRALKRCPIVETYKQFQNYFNATHAPQKPIKPLSDDPRLHDYQRKAQYSTIKYQVYLAWKYQKQLNEYYQRLQQYEKQQIRVRTLTQTYSNTHQQYLRFVFDTLQIPCENHPETNQNAFFLHERPFNISEEARKRHSYITGQSGSGKTELLKTLIHHYITVNQDSAVILLDPHGDISEEVALFKEFSSNDRLVYNDPFLQDDYTLGINPFILDQQTNNTRLIDLTTQELYSVFEEILKGSGFTLQMETLLKPSITTLLLMGNRDISDLMRFMDDDSNAVYLNFAQKHLYNHAQKAFLNQDFHKDSYNPTKQAIKTKIQSLLNSHAFLNMLSGKPTFNLSRLINQRKIIIFNLSVGRLGGFTSDIVGRFLLAQIKSLAFQRAELAENKRVKTHLFIDECQRYLTPSIKTILTEARKYKLHLTLANQYYGQDMTTALKDAITANTAIKITGKNSHKSLSAFQKETGADLEEMEKLEVGEFHIKEGNKPSIRMKAPSNLVGNKNAMRADEWEKVKQEQLALYYQPLKPLHHKTPTQPEPPKAQEKPDKMTEMKQNKPDNNKPKIDL
jgi:GTPase SAR1 family protein